MRAHRFVFVIVTFLVCALIVAFPATADDKKEWQVVRVTDDEEMVEGCVLVGEVKGKSSYGGLLAQNVGEERAYKHLKRNAWEMGGNTVLLLFGRSGFGGSKFRGEAYRCDDSSGETRDLIVLGGVALCQPADESVAYLSAVVDDEVETLMGVEAFRFATPMKLEYAGFEAAGGQLIAVGGLVSQVSVNWIELSKSSQKQVWREMRNFLVDSKGTPDNEDPVVGTMWFEVNRRKITRIVWDRNSGEIRIMAICNDKQAKALMQEARDQDKATKTAAF